MPHWLIKSGLQRLISWLPASQRWNALFQRYATKSIELSAPNFELRLEHCQKHLDHYLQFGSSGTDGLTVFELGTGWFPVVPVGLFLCGVGEQWTFDVSPLLTRRRLESTLARFCDYERSGLLRKFLPGFQVERVSRLREVANDAGQPGSCPDRLERLSIHLYVRDAQHAGLDAGSIRLFVSSGVLEYIPVPVLTGILKEFTRLASRDAVQSHYLNLIDQYSYFDHSITPYNFLQFSSKLWKIYNSPLTWQNRLRISDYRALFNQAGWPIAKETNVLGASEDLKKIRLAPEFRNYAEADLLVLTSWILARGNRA